MKLPDAKSFGEALRRFREASGSDTQQDVANRITKTIAELVASGTLNEFQKKKLTKDKANTQPKTYSKSAVSHWEKGHSIPDVEEVELYVAPGYAAPSSAFILDHCYNQPNLKDVIYLEDTPENFAQHWRGDAWVQQAHPSKIDGKRVRVDLLTLKKGAKTDPSYHRGEEYIVVVKGSIKLYCKDKSGNTNAWEVKAEAKAQVGRNDAISFPSALEHYVENTHDDETILAVGRPAWVPIETEKTL